MAATTSDSLSLAPQVAQATAAAGSRSLPPPAGGGPSRQFLRGLNGSVGVDPNRERTGTQE